MSITESILRHTPRSWKDGVKRVTESDVKWKYIDNMSAVFKHIFHNEELKVAEREVLNDLLKDGIAFTHIDKLFPDCSYLDDLQREREVLEDKYEEQISQARSEVNDTKERKTYLYRMYDQADDMSRENLPMSYIPKMLAHSSSFHRIASSYMGMETDVFYWDYWLTLKNQSENRSQFWHRDQDDRMVIKFFIYLSEVDEDCGPFCYVKDTHIYGHEHSKDPEWFKEKNRSAKRARDEDLEKVICRDKWLKVCGKPGDMFVVDTRGIHKGGLARKDDRRFFQAAYASSCYRGHHIYK